MISIIKMLLALLFLLCIIINSKANQPVNGSEVALTTDFQTGASTVQPGMPDNSSVDIQPRF